MAKRGYKLQEFVAHAGNVNCLSFGKKNCRVFITGGDDQKLNLWSIGKPTSVTSLCGHTSPVESAAFDSAEVLVVAGSSSGAIKLWDLEETKMVRTLTGHRSYCTAVEFHPFGEFFASGSMDTNLKIWDIRKKGCIHTYKGHTRGISTIRFTPDGRWVVSGGFDNVVKVWDLTAGKLLHDFKFHEGHIRSIEFHPLEFLLATGSADKTVKFWDLETFEMIGSARREATGVRSITFHPDGRTLFCGLDDSLKVYSWEPVICHDSVDMGWSTLGDLCIHDGKLLGGAHYENSVAVWVADVSLIEPYGMRSVPEPYSQSEQKDDGEGSLLEKQESHIKLKLNLQLDAQDSDSKEIKTIYVDRVNSVTPKSVDHPVDVPKAVCPSDSKEVNTVAIQKRGPASSMPAKANASAVKNRSIVIPTIVPRDGADGKESVGSRRESIASAKANGGMSAKPSNTRRLSSGRLGMERMSVSVDSVPSENKSNSGIKKDSDLNDKVIVDEDAKESAEGKQPDIHDRLVADENSEESSEEKQSNTNTIAETFDRTSSSPTVSSDQTPDSSKGENPVKVVNGVTVVHGRTRTLVERFEKKEKFYEDEVQKLDRGSSVTAEPLETPPIQKPDGESGIITEPMETPPIQKPDRGSGVTTEPMETPPIQKPDSVAMTGHLETPPIQKPDRGSGVTTGHQEAPLIPKPNKASSVTAEFLETPPVRKSDRRSRVTAEPLETPPFQKPSRGSGVTAETLESPLSRSRGQKTVAREESSSNDNSAIENLMQNHDVLLSTFRSRLTKLQVVRHFWERNDVKGAINAVKKLPDHSVQADVVGVLIERLDKITLDLFSRILPVLLGLLESKAERHVTVSLEMLLKLVAVFGATVHSTVSAPRGVGVDLHAEERRECCNQCYTHLQDIRTQLPELVKRGGSIARFAQQLNLVLQQT